jgi:hypothetical protein
MTQEPQYSEKGYPFTNTSANGMEIRIEGNVITIPIPNFQKTIKI